MEMDKVDMYVMSKGKYFPPEKMPYIREKLLSFDEQRFSVASALDLKDPTTLLIISILIGSLGVDRFMLGETGLGIAKLLTVGGCGIWTIIDWFSVQKRTREQNFNKIMAIM
ncbi:MAG: TM2 domain-containing protein [Saccharofermentanales bacterium]